MRRRHLVPLIFTFATLVMDDAVEDACYVLSALLAGARMLHGPSRCWQKGISRVAVWSFDNMYSDTQCWEQLRVRKGDMPRLAAALHLPDVIVTRDESVFGRMEALVCSFPASHGTARLLGSLTSILGRQAMPSAIYLRMSGMLCELWLRSDTPCALATQHDA